MHLYVNQWHSGIQLSSKSFLFWILENLGFVMINKHFSERTNNRHCIWYHLTYLFPSEHRGKEGGHFTFKFKSCKNASNKLDFTKIANSSKLYIGIIIWINFCSKFDFDPRNTSFKRIFQKQKMKWLEKLCQAPTFFCQIWILCSKLENHLF